jgi:hypothetical protein
MQIHTEFRGIPGIFTAKNTAEFRGILYVFQKIPSVGSQKRTSVDTLICTLKQGFTVYRRGSPICDFSAVQ